MIGYIASNCRKTFDLTADNLSGTAYRSAANLALREIDIGRDCVVEKASI
jgi:hypothetical protein